MNAKAISSYLFLTEFQLGVFSDDDQEIDSYKIRGERLLESHYDFMTTVTQFSYNSDEKIDYQFHLYEIAKKYYGEDGKQIRSFFRDLYLVLFGKENGPRLGQFIEILGHEGYNFFFKKRLKELI